MIIDIFLPLSLIFIMFTLGLGLTADDFIKVVREPKAFGVGILNQMVLLPIIAFSIVSLMGLTKEMAVGMMILACCPGGVTSNIITKLADYRLFYVAFHGFRCTSVEPFVLGINDVCYYCSSCWNRFNGTY